MVENDALRATREAYDAVAETYARMFRDALRDQPLDRAMVTAFAEVVGEGGRVAGLESQHTGTLGTLKRCVTFSKVLR